jgi:hypothetical protein
VNGKKVLFCQNQDLHNNICISFVINTFNTTHVAISSFIAKLFSISKEKKKEKSYKTNEKS